LQNADCRTIKWNEIGLVRGSWNIIISEGKLCKSMMEESRIGVNQSDIVVIAGGTNDVILSRTSWADNVANTTLNK